MHFKDLVKVAKTSQADLIRHQAELSREWESPASHHETVVFYWFVGGVLHRTRGPALITAKRTPGKPLMDAEFSDVVASWFIFGYQFGDAELEFILDANDITDMAMRFLEKVEDVDVMCESQMRSVFNQSKDCFKRVENAIDLCRSFRK